MKIIRNTAPVSDLYNQMKSGELTVNRTYQRSQGLWPANARSYFIDSILNEFPFPKVVIRQTVDLLTRKSKREIVDGQQRLTVIRDFIEDKFKLTRVSSGYSGAQFGSLEQDVQARFLAYEVSMDVIVSATNDEVLEIFRRINKSSMAGIEIFAEDVAQRKPIARCQESAMVSKPVNPIHGKQQ